MIFCPFPQATKESQATRTQISTSRLQVSRAKLNVSSEKISFSRLSFKRSGSIRIWEVLEKVRQRQSSFWLSKCRLGKTKSEGLPLCSNSSVISKSFSSTLKSCKNRVNSEVCFLLFNPRQVEGLKGKTLKFLCYKSKKKSMSLKDSLLIQSPWERQTDKRLRTVWSRFRKSDSSSIAKSFPF